MNHIRYSSRCFDPLPAETLDFLTHLYARCVSTDACLTLTAIHPTQNHPVPSRHIPITDISMLHTALSRLLAANAQGWGAYFAVGLRRSGLGRWQRGDASAVVTLPALFADADRHAADTLAQLRHFPLKPSCIVDSGGGYHAYWWLDMPTCDFPCARSLLRMLAAHLGGDSLSIAQSLRLPGTINTKPNRGGRCHVVECSDVRYSLDDFNTLIGDFSIGGRQKPFTTVQTLHTIHAPPRPNPELLQAVTERLITGFDGKFKPNGYIAALCPCGHQRDRSGMHFNFDPVRGIGVCFGRHGRLLLRELCTELTIDPAEYGKFIVPSAADHPTQRASADASIPDNCPNS